MRLGESLRNLVVGLILLAVVGWISYATFHMVFGLMQVHGLSAAWALVSLLLVLAVIWWS